MMKRPLAAWTLLLVVTWVIGGPATTAAPARGPAAAANSAERPTLAESLADEVREIVNSAMISHGKKERRISTAVRVAVVAATAYKSDPDTIIEIAMELAGEAAAAAPHYADAISKAASFAPAVARIEGASGRIRAATYAAAKGVHGRRAPRMAPAQRPEALAEAAIAQPAPEAGPAAPSPAIGSANEPAAAPQTAEEANTPPPRIRSRMPKIPLGDNAAIHVMADVGVRYDDNLFLSADNKVSSIITTVTPGVELRYGQNSLAHGSFIYREAFTRYSRGGISSLNLGTGNADFGYDDGRLNLVATGSYQQTYGNNIDVLSQGQRTLFRSEVLNLDGSAESQLTPKLSGKIGADLSRTSYQSAGLITNEYVSWPLKLYFKATPKVDLSAGVTYGSQRSQGSAPSGRDLYFNVGARGEFTPKLTGEISAGYRTRSAGDNPTERLWGFDGRLAYELTPKTSATLQFSRDFRTSALGESLKNGQYTFALSSDLTPQWHLGASLTYRDVDYGPALFSTQNVILVAERRDHYWEGGLTASYLFSNWLSATADYTLRNDHSTLPGIEFSDKIMSLTLGLRY